MSRAVLLATLLGWGAVVAPAFAQSSAPIVVAQIPTMRPQGVRPEDVPETPHRSAELECQSCHRGKHRGVLQMYLGLGGRGTPMIPSHMFQVRVECVACHMTPKAEEAPTAVVGQTFRPSEQACLKCHGEKYRGMLEQWSGTLTRMAAVVAPKLAAARDALAGADPRGPKSARAGKLVDDAEFNLRYVTFAKGVHNVFYAADLLKLANGWLDEAAALLGKAASKTDDQLVRGGYCAVLCHQAAGVRQRETVTFGKRAVPHVRHIAEFGATCTSCHSAETHKAVTASAATCAACHHGPQNERCEGCHRQQAAFYRGETKTTLATIAPNLMASAVSCTGCHDFSRKHSRAAVGEKCAGCHEPQYTPLLTEWTTGFDADIRTTTAAVREAEVAVARVRRAGRPTAAAEALLRDARAALALVTTARAAHNPLAADALLHTARAKAASARAVDAGAKK